MPKRRTILLWTLFLAALAFGGWVALQRGRSAELTQERAHHPRERDGRQVVRVLFIGNSLTHWNDLPAIVGSLSETNAAGPILETESLIRMGADLGDHWRAGAADRVAEGDWDIVVLQQGPSSLPESRAALLGYARTCAADIRAAGAEPAFYMVWPEEQHIGSFERVCASYRLAAAEVDGTLLPVGEAWRAAWRADPEMPLYGPDRFHPSAAGSYLAALVITAELTGRPVEELADPASLDPPVAVGDDLTVEGLRRLKKAATAAIAAEKRPTTRAAEAVR